MMKILEAHSGLSALMVERSTYNGIWISSLTHAASKGLPDNELVPLKERVDLVEEIRRIATKPIIVDIDTGGDIDHLPYLIKWFSKAGATAVIMEDKKFPKQNSFIEEGQHLEDVDVFASKIRIAKKHCGDMKVYARLESMIAKKSKYDALLRAEAYIDAGADGIMVHSKQKVDSSEVMEVGNELRKRHPSLTLIAVPTTYTLPDIHPFDVVIHANHQLRASMHAMMAVAAGTKVDMVSVQDIFDFVGH